MRVERFPRRRRLVRGTIIIAHIWLPSEVTVRGASVCPRRWRCCLLRGAGGVDVVVECIDETINAGVHPFVDFPWLAKMKHRRTSSSNEIGDAFRHHEILRVLVEEVVAAHQGECEQAETWREKIYCFS